MFYNSSFLMLRSVEASPLLTGLLAYYKLDSNSNDSAGSSNGVDTGITYSAGKINNGASSSSAGRITITSTALDLDNMTVSAWVNLSSHNYWFIATRVVGNGGSQNDYEIRTNPGGGLEWAALGTGSGFLGLSAWHHIVAGRTAGSAKLYIDGTLRASGSVGTGGYLPSQPTLIGSRDDNYTGLGFQVDEVGFWNRELTGSEVALLYNGGAGLSHPF